MRSADDIVLFTEPGEHLHNALQAPHSESSIVGFESKKVGFERSLLSKGKNLTFSIDNEMLEEIWQPS